MLIKKEYKFYAGHRNQDLINSPCFRIHGHNYFLSVFFKVKRVDSNSITTLFDEFDRFVEPLLKGRFDHRMFLDVNDSLKKYLDLYQKETGEDSGYCPLPFPSSVENLGCYIFHLISKKFDLDRIELKETNSSTLIYSSEDFKDDIRMRNKILDFEISEEEHRFYTGNHLLLKDF